MSELIPRLKRCSKKANCVHPEQIDGGWLPATLDYFYKLKTGKNGLHPECKYCFNERSRTWRAAHPEKVKAIKQRYVEAHPDKRKETYQNYTRKNASGLSEYQHRYKQENPDKRKQTTSKSYAKRKQEKPEVFRAYTLNRRSKEKSAEGSHTAQDIRDQFIRQNGLCFYCDEALDEHYHVDHVIPLTKGGSNNPDNLVCACERCNKSKSDRTPTRWLKHIRDNDLYRRVNHKITVFNLP